MTGPRRRSEKETSARLSIGALSRATGIPVETLRTWESRYGFPVPERKPSGHRVYSMSSIPRLRRIAQALALGHRAGQVVGAPDAALEQLLEASTPEAPSAGLPLLPVADTKELMGHIESFDAPRFTRVLLGEHARLGILSLLQERISPLLREVGAAWESGRIEVRHEHFAAERIGDLLRSLRLPLEERARGPLVVFGSLSGESHGLGLQMAALVLAAAGLRVLYLGTEVPTPQIASLARDLNARAVGVSVSLASRGAATATQLRRLRELLPRRVTLLVGGDGAPRPRPGIEVIQDLRKLDDWGRRIVGNGHLHA